MHRFLFAAVSLSWCSALAQEPALTPPPPPPPQQEYRVDAPVQQYEERYEEPRQSGRVRWGLNAQLGAFITPGAFLLGLEGRVGYQFHPLFALYGDLGANAGIGFSAAVSPSGAVTAGVNLVSFWHIGVNAELTLGDHFYLAAGPHFASAAWGAVLGTGSSSGGSGKVMVVAGPMPALDARLGFMTGKRRPDGRRSGFSIGLDVLTLFAPNALYFSGSGGSTGGSGDVTQGSAIGIAPTLTLGFDAM